MGLKNVLHFLKKCIIINKTFCKESTIYKKQHGDYIDKMWFFALINKKGVRNDKLLILYRKELIKCHSSRLGT